MEKLAGLVLILLGIHGLVDLYRRHRSVKRLLFLARMTRGKVDESLYEAMVKAIYRIP